MIIGAAGLLVAAAALLVLDVANLFHQQRALQKAADAAALAAVEVLDDGCVEPPATARAIARANGFPDDGTLGAECGLWAVDGRAQTPQTLSNYFEPGSVDVNAVRVRLARDVPFFLVFGGAASRRIDAEATATGRPLDAFSIGSGLLGLADASLVNRLLGRLLGSNVNLDLVSYQGLANAKLRLLDLARADPIGVGTVDQLLASNVRLGDLLLASADALAADDALAATALQTLALQAPNVNVALSDLLRVDSPTPAAAGEARVSAFDLLMTAAQIANGSNLLDLGTVISVPGVANVSLQAAVIEPAQIAVGGVGAMARTAQVRLKLNVQALRLSTGAVTLTALNLPVFLETLPAQATLTRMRCGPTAERSSVGIEATSGVLDACLSGVLPANLASAAAPCTVPATLTQVSILGVGLVSVRGTASVDLTDPGVKSLTFGEGGPAGSSVSNEVQRVDSLPSSTVDHALGTLVDTMTLTSTPAVLAALINPTLGAVDTLLNSVVTDPLLVPLLRTVVDPTLRLLGVSVGFGDVHQMDLMCRRSDLVY